MPKQYGFRRANVNRPDTPYAEEVLNFGAFQLLRSRKELLSNGVRIRLGGRALDLLTALVERAGEIVSKGELIALAWPTTYVEESNLRVHITALRKLLGNGDDGYRLIINVPGRGYSFIGFVHRTATEIQAVPVSEQPLRLPAQSARLVGREDDLASLLVQVGRRRLVSVVGPAGVGKSTLALAAAEHLAVAERIEVCFVAADIIENATLLPAAVAVALGLSSPTDATASLLAYLADREVLIVVDNVEHIADAIAALVGGIMSAAPAVKFLVTSREPLRLQGESLKRLAPLAIAPCSEHMTLAEVVAYPAVQLFVQSALASCDTLELSDDDAGLLVEICQRLDGLPLAIELVASRVDLFGLAGMTCALDDQLLLQTAGARGALPRQRSLHGAISWSHALLGEDERQILRRLSIFRSRFTLQSAVDVLSDDTMNAQTIREGILTLAEKSLVATDVSGTNVLYRLLHSTRAYASDRLEEAGEVASLQRRHGAYHQGLLQGALAEWEKLSRTEWLANYSYLIDDVRAALDWAFGPDGDPLMAASLTVAALPFGYQLALLDEFKRRAEMSLAILERTGDGHLIARLRLTTALCLLALNAGLDRIELHALLAKVRDLAASVSEPRYRIEPALSEVIVLLEDGSYREAVEATRVLDISVREQGDPLGILLADRVAAQTAHFAGDHGRAKTLAERVLRHSAGSIPMVYSQVPVDRRVSMRIILARVRWIEGSADQAIQLMREALSMAVNDGPFATCQTLALGACPLALWVGNDGEAARTIELLLDQARRYSLARWLHLGRCYQTALEARGRRELDPASLTDQPMSRPEPAGIMQHETLVTINPSLIDSSLVARVRAGQPTWCGPEILRAYGEQLLDLHGHAAASMAERHFEDALAMAREQGALAWQLRAVLSLARLWSSQGHDEVALNLLGDTVPIFREGHGTKDLREASALIHRISGGPQPRFGSG
jgi:predicted ATPase/DNA-binding winged helix-turn-helix (wHTH) protein